MCVPGKLEYKSGRMHLVTFDQDFDVKLKRFKDCAIIGSHTSLVVEFDGLDGETVEQQLYKVAALVAPHFGVSVDSLVDEGLLSFDLDLACPVTAAQARYTFYGVFFSNRSRNEDDALFDPPQFTPIPSILFSCDALSFAVFVRDAAIKHHKCLPHQLSQEQQSALFHECVGRWHKSSIATLRQFGKISDTIRIESAEHWIANHRDPVFAELKKRPYRHELPSVYCASIVHQWERVLHNWDGSLSRICGGQSAIGEV